MRIQKGKIRFSKRDLWNLDYTLSEIIVQALEQFKEDVNSNIRSVPPHLISDDITHEYIESDEYYEKQWEYILDKMLWGFKEIPEYFETEEYVEMYWNTLSNPEKFTEGENPPKEYEGMGVCFKYRTKLKDGYTQADVDAQKLAEETYTEAKEQRIKDGREVFFKYFDRLWT